MSDDTVEFDTDLDPSMLDPDLKSAANIKLDSFSFLLYGQPGSGKTTMIGTFPRRILYFNPTTENSVNTLRGDKDVHYWDIRSADEFVQKALLVEEWIKQGTFQKVGYSTVVVDSLSFLVDLVLNEKRHEGKRDGKLVQADWATVANFILDMVKMINAWPGCHKVWTAGVDTEKDELTGDIEGYPKMFKSLQRTLPGMMDVVLYLEASKDLKTNKPAWYAHTARHRYFSARVRGAPVPGKIEPTFEAVLHLLDTSLYGTPDENGSNGGSKPADSTPEPESQVQ